MWLVFAVFLAGAVWLIRWLRRAPAPAQRARSPDVVRTRCQSPGPEPRALKGFAPALLGKRKDHGRKRPEFEPVRVGGDIAPSENPTAFACGGVPRCTQETQNVVRQTAAGGGFQFTPVEMGRSGVSGFAFKQALVPAPEFEVTEGDGFGADRARGRGGLDRPEGAGRGRGRGRPESAGRGRGRGRPESAGGGGFERPESAGKGGFERPESAGRGRRRGRGGGQAGRQREEGKVLFEF